MSPLLLLASLAHASCQLMQTATATGTRLDLTANAEPLSCRRITLRTPTETPKVEVRIGKRRPPKDHVRVTPGQVEIGLPELLPGDTATVDVSVPGDKLEVILGTPPAPAPTAAETHVTWTVELNAKHPGWGFADPAFAATHKEIATLGPDGHRTEEERGAAPQGTLTLAPGSFTLHIPGAHLYGTGSADVQVTHLSDGLRFDAPKGGEARWIVLSVVGAGVIPDSDTYISGIDWRFRQVSLPEPAIPARLASVTDKLELAQALYDEVRGPVDGWLPGPDALHPRQLNRAWRSGWLTPVERGLVLDRMLMQGRIVSAWALTGSAPDPLTLTGFDHMLLAAQLGEREVLLDPACAACAFDEVSTKVVGKPALGATRVVPLSPGTLERTIKLVGTEFQVHVKATGAGALWLREAVWGLSDARRDAVLGEHLGLDGAKIAATTGLDEPGAPVELDLTGERSPKPLFSDTEAPWIGGWADL